MLLAPPAALPDDDVLGELLEVEPPEAESFFAGSVVDDGELGVVVPEAEPEAEPDGELGVVAEPDEEVAPEPGAAPRLPALSPQAVSMPAPSAMEIATAKAESLI